MGDDETSIEIAFRTEVKNDLYKAITDQCGNIVEVFGPPMVGKSVLIQQVVEEIRYSLNSHGEEAVCYNFWCKNMYILQELIVEMIRVIDPYENHLPSRECDQYYDLDYILNRIKKTVEKQRDILYILVFHKCESFCEKGKSQPFLSFLGEIANMFRSNGFKVHLVFSTYKKFGLVGHKTSQVNVRMLTDTMDILSILHQNAPRVPISRLVDYVYICRRYLCLPGPIVRLAVQFVSKNVYTPELLEGYICSNSEFYTELFDSRSLDVYKWLTKAELELVFMLCKAGLNPFSKDQVKSVLESLQNGDVIYMSLMKNMVIEEIGRPTNVTVHPLVLYNCMKFSYVGEQQNINTVNSYTQLIGNVLMKAELNRQKHTIPGQTYGCHRSEWPAIRDLCEAAIHTGQFKDIFKVAVVARRLIMVMFPNESKLFYQGLFKSAQNYGSPKEAAVMEACLGHITASGAGVNFPLALRRLDSALETLKRNGPSFFYKWTLRRKAIILYRVSRYPESIKYFQKAKSAEDRFPMSPTERESLGVSLLQEDEEKLIGEIYETIPMIFSGDNETALQKLLSLNESINYRFENHPDRDIMLNNIGLALQRGYKDLKGALVWYSRSLELRSHLVNINPLNMLVTLNNVGMIKFRTGDIVGAEHDLQRCITILRESCWYQYNTALTLTHLAEIKAQLKKFQEAYDSVVKADEILHKIYKNNDYRLKINMGMIHYRFLLDNVKDKNVALTSVDESIQKLVDLGFSINKNMSDDSHHYMMSVFEHGLALSLGVSLEKMKTYRDMLLEHVDQNSIVKETMEKADPLAGRQSLLSEHRSFIEYVKNTEVVDLELQKLLEYLHKACPICQTLNKVLGKEIWLKDHIYSSQGVKGKPIVGKERDWLRDFSSFSDISNGNAILLDLMSSWQEQLHQTSQRPNIFMAKHDSELMYLYHSNSRHNTRLAPTNTEGFLNNLSQTTPWIEIINPSTTEDINYKQINITTPGRGPNSPRSCLAVQSSIFDEAAFNLLVHSSQDIDRNILFSPAVVNPSDSPVHSCIIPGINLTFLSAEYNYFIHWVDNPSSSFDQIIGLSPSVFNPSAFLDQHNVIPLVTNLSLSVGNTCLSPLVANPSNSIGSFKELNTVENNETVSMSQTCTSPVVINTSVSLEQIGLLTPVTTELNFTSLTNTTTQVVNPSVSVGESTCMSPTVANKSISVGQCTYLSQAAAETSPSVEQPVYLSPTVANTSISVGQMVIHCPCFDDPSILNPSSLYSQFSPTPLAFSVAHADLLNESQLHSSMGYNDIMSGFLNVSSPVGQQSSELLSHTLSSTFTYLDYPPSSLSSSTHCKIVTSPESPVLEEYFWVSCPVDQEQHSHGFPSNPVYSLGSGLYLADHNVHGTENESRHSLNQVELPFHLLNEPIVLVEHANEFRSCDSNEVIHLQDL